MKPKNQSSKKLAFPRLSLYGHQSFTIFIVSLTLFIAVCVYFVNAVVINTGTDEAYRAQAEANAQLTNFHTSLLKQAQEFSANANNTDLPAGRINPFTP